MKLYNSLTKKKSLFRPLKSGQVGIYTCGPTVYDHVHIGNLRSFITVDLLVRVLREVEGYKVKWVMNTTDIDDKIIDRLNRDHKHKQPEAARAVMTKKYEKLFLEDIEAVGVDTKAIKLVRATEHIDEMQRLIKHLLKDDIAYIADGSIYFSIFKYQRAGHKYGLLSKIDFDGQSRLTDDQDQKEGLADFALWKAAKAGEPAWDFVINGKNLRGRPGWHIECSAMSIQYLGDVFDIHTGGVDLRFPHHENEIAQCGGQLARCFVHNEMLTIDKAKMSKSLNNFYKLADIKDGLALRHLVMGAHYRSKMDFSMTALEAARTRLNHINEFTSKLLSNPLSSQSGKQLAKKTQRAIEKALSDDLDTPKALAELAELTRSTELDSRSMLKVLRFAEAVFGLGIDEKALTVDRQAIAKKLQAREQTRQAKNFDAADKLRHQLAKSKIGVEDTKKGQIIWQIQV